MNKGSIAERLCSDLDRKEPRYKSPTLLYFTAYDVYNYRPFSLTCAFGNVLLSAMCLLAAEGFD